MVCRLVTEQWYGENENCSQIQGALYEKYKEANACLKWKHKSEILEFRALMAKQLKVEN